MLLEIKDLWVHYEKAVALKGISMDVEEGSIVTLLGSNGAGKTTLLRTISSLKRPTSGEILYQGKRIDRLPAYEIVKRGIAHVPEGRQLFYSLSVMQNLKMGGYLLKSTAEFKNNLQLLMEHFPALKNRIKHQATDLSGGEQQMVAIARSLMTNPKVLLMDEPSLGLSPLLVKELSKMITEISQTGVTILLVEQNAHMALRLASYAYVLEVGRVVSESEAKAMLSDETVKRAYLGYKI